MKTQQITAIYSTQKNRLGKRIFDIAFSLTFLTVFFPIYLITALFVKITSPGPIFFKGLRMGQNGELITCFKFRTMCIDAEEKLDELLKSAPQLRYEWETFHKLKKDPRLTKIGNFLRKTSLDEIPQFWNVLKGDISVVGPRPIEIRVREKAWEEIEARYGAKTKKILSAKPGITCIWQTRGRNNLTFQKRIQFEEEYIDSQSLWLDLKIIFKTVLILFSLKGAY